MSIRTFQQHHPQIDRQAFVDPSSLIIGQVTLAKQSSIWPHCVLRGDVNTIAIDACTNIQDGTIIHVSHISSQHPTGQSTVVGHHVTVGHRVLLHGCHIGNHCLIGMSSTIMDGVVIEDGVMLGAGSLVPPHKRLASGQLYLGRPAKQVRALTKKEQEWIRYSAQHYCELAQATQQSLAE